MATQLTTLERSLMAINDRKDRAALRAILQAIADRLSSVATMTAGLVIKTGGSTLAKTGAAAFQAIVDGALVTIAAATDMPALTGLTIAANQFNVACFFVDKAGTVTVAFGTAGASKATVKFPPFPQKKALVGFLIITHSSTFTGGTTALDTATTEYVSPVGGINPHLLLS